MTDNTNNQNKEGMNISSILAGIILGLIACALITLFSSCTTTKYVPVIEHHTDTLIQTKVQKDSVFMHDSVEVRIAGDTVTIDRWHTKYISKEVHDTIYQSKTDSVPAPYPVEVINEVPAELTTWQRLKMKVGGTAIVICLLAFLIWVWRTK
jgi:hypothetical protein